MANDITVSPESPFCPPASPIKMIDQESLQGLANAM
jgi:hypothetical protein